MSSQQIQILRHQCLLAGISVWGDIVANADAWLPHTVVLKILGPFPQSSILNNMAQHMCRAETENERHPSEMPQPRFYVTVAPFDEECTPSILSTLSSFFEEEKCSGEGTEKAKALATRNGDDSVPCRVLYVWGVGPSRDVVLICGVLFYWTDAGVHILSLATTSLDGKTLRKRLGGDAGAGAK